jgi:hypothetical protein
LGFHTRRNVNPAHQNSWNQSRAWFTMQDDVKVNYDQMGQCAQCLVIKAINQMKVCSGCRKILYCNPQCQRAHWVQHSSDCTRR